MSSTNRIQFLDEHRRFFEAIADLMRRPPQAVLDAGRWLETRYAEAAIRGRRAAELKQLRKAIARHRLHNSRLLQKLLMDRSDLNDTDRRRIQTMIETGRYKPLKGIGRPDHWHDEPERPEALGKPLSKHARFLMAWSFVLGNPDRVPLRILELRDKQKDAASILVLIWLVTDPNANAVKGVTRFHEGWEWKPLPDGQVRIEEKNIDAGLERYFTLGEVIRYLEQIPDWIELVAEALEVVEDLGTFYEPPPAAETTPTQHAVATDDDASRATSGGPDRPATDPVFVFDPEERKLATVSFPADSNGPQGYSVYLQGYSHIWRLLDSDPDHGIESSDLIRSAQRAKTDIKRAESFDADGFQTDGSDDLRDAHEDAEEKLEMIRAADEAADSGAANVGITKRYDRQKAVDDIIRSAGLHLKTGQPHQYDVIVLALKTRAKGQSRKSKSDVTNVRSQLDRAYKVLVQNYPKMVVHFKRHIRYKSTLWKYSPDSRPNWQLE